jgi:hypothetical protein
VARQWTKLCANCAEDFTDSTEPCGVDFCTNQCAEDYEARLDEAREALEPRFTKTCRGCAGTFADATPPEGTNFCSVACEASYDDWIETQGACP